MHTTGDPTQEAPAWARPTASIVSGALIHGLVLSIFATGLYDDGLHRPAMLVVWALIGVLVTAPAVLVFAVVAIARERWITGRAHAGRFLWGGYALGAGLVAHWVPLLPWSPLALLMGADGGPHGAAFRQSAVMGLVAWVLVAVGVGVLAWTRWAFRSRPPGTSRTWAPLLPAWALAVLQVGVATWLLPVGLLGWLAGSRAPVGPTVAAGLALIGAGLAAGLLHAWSVAQADVTRARLTEIPVDFQESLVRTVAATAVFIGVSLFTMASLVDWGSALGSRFVLQILGSIVTGSGVGLLAAAGLGWWLAAPVEDAG